MAPGLMFVLAQRWDLPRNRLSFVRGGYRKGRTQCESEWRRSLLISRDFEPKETTFDLSIDSAFLRSVHTYLLAGSLNIELTIIQWGSRLSRPLGHG